MIMVMSSFAQSSVFKMFAVNKKTAKSYEKAAFSSEFLWFKELFRKALFSRLISVEVKPNQRSKAWCVFKFLVSSGQSLKFTIDNGLLQLLFFPSCRIKG